MVDDKTVLAARLVAAYLAKGPLAARDLPELIRGTHAALAGVASPEPAAAGPQRPFVPVKKSVAPDAITCLECGKRQKMLKPHLRAAHGLSVDDYRERWSLAADYPMVAPDYAAHRSEMAFKIGLGQRKAAVAAAPAPAAPAEPAGPAGPKPGHQYPPSRWSKPSQ